MNIYKSQIYSYSRCSLSDGTEANIRRCGQAIITPYICSCKIPKKKSAPKKPYKFESKIKKIA